MREIKFRVWDRVDYICSPFTLEDLQLKNVQFTSDCIVMQFTGLLDKNDVEIYEGDIVKFHYFYGSGGLEGFVEAEHELTGVIEWGAYGWGVYAIEGEHWNGYTGYADGEGSSNFMDLVAMNESSIHEESFEVIGNIYQNPELIINNTAPPVTT
jgi:uncharacterized phage protein (TIGR01671 family)